MGRRDALKILRKSLNSIEKSKASESARTNRRPLLRGYCPSPLSTDIRNAQPEMSGKSVSVIPNSRTARGECRLLAFIFLGCFHVPPCPWAGKVPHPFSEKDAIRHIPADSPVGSLSRKLACQRCNTTWGESPLAVIPEESGTRAIGPIWRARNRCA
jgi:hypothetical protein